MARNCANDDQPRNWALVGVGSTQIICTSPKSSHSKSVYLVCTELLKEELPGHHFLPLHPSRCRPWAPRALSERQKIQHASANPIGKCGQQGRLEAIDQVEASRWRPSVWKPNSLGLNLWLLSWKLPWKVLLLHKCAYIQNNITNNYQW